MVHFRTGIDPDDPRLGISPLRPILREIVTDNEASGFMAALLRNMGVPTVLISPANEQDSIGTETARRIREEFGDGTAGENAGTAFVPGFPLKVETLSLTPEAMRLERFRFNPEARIAGALRVPPMVVGLSVGDITRTYSNYGQARKAAYEDCLMPLGRQMAKAAGKRLLPEFDGEPGEWLGWDYSQVAALGEDQTEIYRRNNLAVLGGWMMRNEARERAGLPRDPQGDVYLDRRPSNNASEDFQPSKV